MSIQNANSGPKKHCCANGKDTYENVCKTLINLDTPDCGLEVRESLIPNAGDGIFATKPFSAGEPITRYTGEIITHKEAKIRREKGEDTHIIRLFPFAYYIDAKRSVNGKHVITDPKKQLIGRGVAGFVNDSLEPERNNVKFDFIDSNHNLAVLNNDIESYNKLVLNPLERVKFLRATKDIAIGDELYASYGSDYWKRYKKREVSKKAAKMK